MNLLKSALIDKFIIHHLALGGALDDPQFDAFVNQLVEESLKNTAIGAAASAQMLSQADLVLAYKTVVKDLYPDIFISHGDWPIISASMPFIDAQNFPSFAATLGSGISVSDPPDLRSVVIAQNAVTFFQQLWQEAVAEGKSRPKEWAFERVKEAVQQPQGKGCIGVLLAGFIGGGTLAAGVWLLYEIELTMHILKWAIFLFHVLCTFGLTLFTFTVGREEYRRFKTMLHCTIAYWLLAVWMIVFPTFGKLHVIWLDPLIFVLSVQFLIRRQMYLTFGRVYGPPPLSALLFVLGAALVLCTWLNK